MPWASSEACLHRLALQREGTGPSSLLHDDGWHDRHLPGRVAHR